MPENGSNSDVGAGNGAARNRADEVWLRQRFCIGGEKNCPCEDEGDETCKTPSYPAALFTGENCTGYSVPIVMDTNTMTSDETYNQPENWQITPTNKDRWTAGGSKSVMLPANTQFEVYLKRDDNSYVWGTQDDSDRYGTDSSTI